MNEIDVIKKLKSLANPGKVEGMARFGINPYKTLGVSLPDIRKMAKGIGMDHSLSLKLWKSGIHEARLLASIIGDPERVTERQMERWAKDFDSWDVVDVCAGLFERTRFCEKKITQWTKREEEFVKRMGFVLMCAKAVHDKEAKEKEFEKYFPIIRREAKDGRNFVRKAVNWALRQIGKRNAALNKKAIKTAKEIEKIDSKSARWIAADALRELTNEKIQERVKSRSVS